MFKGFKKQLEKESLKEILDKFSFVSGCLGALYGMLSISFGIIFVKFIVMYNNSVKDYMEAPMSTFEVFFNLVAIIFTLWLGFKTFKILKEYILNNFERKK